MNTKNNINIKKFEKTFQNNFSSYISLIKHFVNILFYKHRKNVNFNTFDIKN